MWKASAIVATLCLCACDHQSVRPDEPTKGESVRDQDRQIATNEALEFLKHYNDDLAKLEEAQTSSYWTAANSGKKEDFDRFAERDLALKSLHADHTRYEVVKKLLLERDALDSTTARSLEVAELVFRGNQLPQEMLERLTRASTEIEQLFNTFRADLDGEKLSNNQLLEQLASERDTGRRARIWQALKDVGQVVGPKLVALAKLRNEAARSLGFANYWQMQVRLQEHDPAQLIGMFDELERLTDEPFRQMKAKLDSELAARFGIKPEEVMPWHYDNPFFQDAPPSAEVDLDDLYKHLNQNQVVEIAKKYYRDIGLPIDDIVQRSDFFEREGKDQHAFCISINRKDDVRMLLNIKPTANWMGTMLHEAGHAVYYKFINRDLPHNLREAAHIFTTEAVAMLFGAYSSDPDWMVRYAGVTPELVEPARKAIHEQRRREQLIFARWSMVMLNFEKALYEDPDQDLNKRWYDVVERFQFLKRPRGRNASDWAAKPHFTIAPVYYHNYMLGELFAAQLRATIARSEEKPAEKGKKMIALLFGPGMSKPWPAFVEEVTGRALSPEAFASEVR